MSELLNLLKRDQVAARKNAMATKTAEATWKAGLLTTLIAEASVVSAEDFKKGVKAPTDERVMNKLKAFRSNIELTLHGDPAKSIAGVGEGDARQKLEFENGVLADYIPKALTKAELNTAVDVAAEVSGIKRPLEMKDMRAIKSALEARYPGQIDGKALSDLIKAEASK